MAVNLNDTTPAAPSGAVNVKWQADGSGNASAYVSTVGGGLITSAAKSTNGTISATGSETVELVTTGSSTITRTLPPSASSTDVVITEKKVDSGSGTVVVQAGGSPAESIDGSSSYTLVNQYQFVRLLCDGTGWNVIGGN